MAKIYVLHENDEWLPPFRAAFEEAGLPYEEWHLAEGLLPFDEAPPQGVFYSRMSASAHTRGHAFAPEFTRIVLNWLELHGRRVVNGSSALALEVSKIAQYAALRAEGIPVPRTRAAVGKAALFNAALEFGETPFILKPNRGGKGLGVQLFNDLDSLQAYLEGPSYEQPVDGTWLVQQYIRAAEPFITRAEFIGGKFHYAVKVDTSEGFELCPSDACAVEEAFCPAAPEAVSDPARPKFQIIKDFSDPIIARIERVLEASGVEVAGVEFIREPDGGLFVYDINSNTNYNNAAERAAGVPEIAPARLARFLGEELKRVQRQSLAAE
jgi:glutathione synthase/RimK-type ligase-like ATP-grasp enzyme